MKLTIATPDDISDIKTLMELAIRQLQKGYLTDAQIEASFAGMGLDTQLIDDQTYFCIRGGQKLIGCGGWSRRSTLYGGSHSAGRNAALLDPQHDRARIRAMYTHPDYVRRGIGKMIIDAGENAARAEGFKALEMAASMAGVPFYKKCGYHIESEWEDRNGDVAVPLCTMVKSL